MNNQIIRTHSIRQKRRTQTRSKHIGTSMIQYSLFHTFLPTNTISHITTTSLSLSHRKQRSSPLPPASRSRSSTGGSRANSNSMSTPSANLGLARHVVVWVFLVSVAVTGFFITGTRKEQKRVMQIPESRVNVPSCQSKKLKALELYRDMRSREERENKV
jgi:hypothetical protein